MTDDPREAPKRKPRQIERKLEECFRKIEHASDYTPEDKAMISSQIALAIRNYESIERELIDRQVEMNRDPRWDILSRIQTTLAQAIEIGAASESIEAMKRLRVQAASNAGKSSARVRNEKADEAWRNHATELAQIIRQKKPNISQKNLATDIQSEWKNEGFVPGFDALLLHVKRLETSGDLPRRRPKQAASSTKTEY